MGTHLAVFDIPTAFIRAILRSGIALDMDMAKGGAKISHLGVYGR